MDSGATCVRLPYTPPYDWAAISAFLAARAIPGVEWVDEAGAYHRSIAVGDAHGTARIEAGNGAGLIATLHFPHARDHTAITERLGRVFDLGADPLAIGAHLSLDRTLALLVQAHPGLRMPRGWDGFEIAVRAILGQQITVSAATKLAGKLVAAHGVALNTPYRGITHVFPSAARLAVADLQTLGMPGARARALSAIAAAVVVDPELLSPMRPLEATLQRLRSLPGIGEWTAQYIAMRALGSPDALPVADIGLLRALADLDGRRPTAAELLARAEAWRPWRTYAVIHLWTGGSSARR